VLVTELAEPRVVRLQASLALAVYEGEAGVEGVVGVRREPEEVEAIREDLAGGRVPVVVEPGPGFPAGAVLVDAVMAKRNTGTSMGDAAVVVALGPGFTAGVDCHAVVETLRGHDLGRVIYVGSTRRDTGVPGEIGGEGARRLLRATREGVIRCRRRIGDSVREGDQIAEVEGEPVRAALTGVLRGLIRDGLRVRRGEKIGDIDPRADPEACATVSDRARAVAGGVLEAILHILQGRPRIDPHAFLL